MTTAHRPSGSAPRPGGIGPVLRPALVVTLVLGLVMAVLAAGVGGRPAVLGVLVAVAMVTGFFGLGASVMAVAARLAPATSLLVALVTYTLQVVLVGLVFVTLTGSGALDEAVDARWVAGALIVGTFGWLAAQVRASTTVRLPVYDLPDRSGTEPARRSVDSVEESRGDGSSTVSDAKEAGAR